jgi:potassium-transporting ATPase KdpC subunit
MKQMRMIGLSAVFLVVMTILTGVAYPLLVTGIGTVLFPRKAAGSLIVINGQVRGSYLLSQDFHDSRFFRARPSATNYQVLGAGGSNMAPTNGALTKAVEDRRNEWEKSFGGKAPDEMLYASASGLDPEISLSAALAQVKSVAAARGYDAAQALALDKAVRKTAGHADQEQSSSTSARVNVVALNAALESGAIFKQAQ